jgi:hypothetical protein
VKALGPGEFAEFGRTFDATCGSLVDVDVCVAFVIGVLLAVQGNGCERDGLAGDPADALECEDGISVVGEGFVLRAVRLRFSKINRNRGIEVTGNMERDIPSPTRR